MPLGRIHDTEYTIDCRHRRLPNWMLGLLLTVASGGAGAATTTHVGECAEPSGRIFRVTYSFDTDPNNPVAQVTSIQVQNSGASSFTTYNDDSTTTSRLEVWSPTTFDDLFLHPGSDGFSSPAVTLALDSNGYATWWINRDGPAAILAQPAYTFLNPRVEFRTNTNVLDRGADSCDIFLVAHTTTSGNAARVAHIGDSISDQMAPQLVKLNASRRYFIDPQSGQSYRTMIGEARGITAGIRDSQDPNGKRFRPDVLVIALGTNDAGAVTLNRSQDFNAFTTGLSWIVARMLIDTDAVACRVLMTVRTIGKDADAPDDLLARAEDAFNGMIRKVVSDNPTRFRLVDFEKMSDDHRPGSSVPWFTTADRTHPTTPGLTALSDEIVKQTNSCLGN